MTIEEKRRELFEAWAEDMGLPLSMLTCGEWAAFNAAIDAVLIELPTERSLSASDDPWYVRELCIDAIESTGLGLKVKS